MNGKSEARTESAGSGSRAGSRVEVVASRSATPSGGGMEEVVGKREDTAVPQAVLPDTTVDEPAAKEDDRTTARVERQLLATPSSSLAPSSVSPSTRTSSDLSAKQAPANGDGAVEDVGDETTVPALEAEDPDQRPSKPRTEHDASDQRWQEEMHTYIEKIDALQAKLQYLTKEAAESAHQASASAQPESAEQKILEKQERIALLMQEGQKLSRTEMKHLAIIKKLRSQAAETTKEQSAIKARAEKAEKTLFSTEQRLQRAEAAQRRAEEILHASAKSARDLEAIAKEGNALKATVAEMRAQLTRANARAESAEAKAQSESREREKSRAEELQTHLIRARTDRDLSEEQLRREITDLKATIAREKEHSRALETELLGEQAMLESKLESMRARAEEASSDTLGDGPAKLLRQIETLQTQYSVAGQNWQGIESSLVARIANLEKERDAVSKREGDLRRKVRDTTLKAKTLEMELESGRDTINELERKGSELEAEMQRLSRRARESADELARSQAEVDEQGRYMEREFSRRLEEERAKWYTSLSSNVLLTGSPVAAMRKSPGLDLGHMLAGSTHSDTRSATRRPSVLPLDSPTPPRQDSTSSLRAPTNGAPAETPSIHSADRDEYFSNMPPTPASPSHNHRGLNDLISNSTIGAGPSVQLVERMSASVRRLEAEKAASKDELARLSSQRDEARREVVGLMREVEQKRAAEERIKVLEEEQKSMNERYQTTLELLGEKSELVEELRADVADVKEMYKDLVDRTMK